MKLINKKAKFDYFLTDNLEVGLVLHGPEVKAIIKGSLSLKESYVKIINTVDDKPEVFLLNASISEMLQENDTLRPKKLLLHKKQILKFKKLLQTPGTTLVLYEVYTDENGRLKGTLCLGKGKKQHDKRQVIKERDIARHGI